VSGRILVIEDEFGERQVLQHRLQDLGHTVVMAETGAQGIAQARSAPFDLYLVDVQLGDGLDGYEVCRRLKRSPDTRNIPVVLISGKVKQRSELHRGYEAGCEAFLEKKGDYSLVEDVIRAMLRYKSLQDELSAQNRLLEQQNQRLRSALEELKELKSRDSGSGASGAHSSPLRARRPDGALLVDVEGTVQATDRGAQDLFAQRLEGRHLGGLAPGTSLEAYVRDSRSGPRSGELRINLPARSGRTARTLLVSALPLVPKSVQGESDLRVVLLYDEYRQRTNDELTRLGSERVSRTELGTLLEAAHAEFQPSRLLGASHRMVELRERVHELCTCREPVLIRGQAGTGKAFAGRILHYAQSSPAGASRASSGQVPVSGPFLAVDCGALDAASAEEELFGVVQTYDAEAGELTRPGALQQAYMGTLLLEGVEKLGADVQEKLLEALRTGTVQRVGSSRAEPIEVRILATTELDLDAEGAAGRIHPGLLEYLGANQLELPALRDRREDLAPLVRHLLRRFGTGDAERDFTTEAWRVLLEHDWPGNVEELEACVERACLAADGAKIEVGDLPPPLPDLQRKGLHVADPVTPVPPPAELPAGTHSAYSAASQAPQEDMGLVSQILLDSILELDDVEEGEDEGGIDAEGEHVPVRFEFFEKVCLRYALSKTSGDKLRAAKLLNVGKSTLYRKLNRYGIK